MYRSSSLAEGSESAAAAPVSANLMYQTVVYIGIMIVPSGAVAVEGNHFDGLLMKGNKD